MILSAKADGLLNCILAPEPDPDMTLSDENTEIAAEMPENNGIGEEEGYKDLFGGTEESKTTEKERKKPKGSKKPGISVTWKKKFQELVGNLYDNVNKESV